MNFNRLTSTGVSDHSARFGVPDVNSTYYMATDQANENIKALLEGAFEDDEKDDGGNRTRRKRKGKGRKQEQQSSEKKDLKDDEVDGLASQLQGVAVADKDPEKAVKPEASTETKYSDLSKEDEEEEGEEEDDDDGTVEGLKVKLLPHQIDGVQWMCDKEIGHKKGKGVVPKGGILADDMGLGKTIQAISLMLSNQPSGLSKSTLVVAPLALIKQWESEIEGRVDESHKLAVLLYHGAARAKTSDKLGDYDVVITTYGTLSSEYAGTGNDYKTGLFAVHWHRIILDEAHTIKNRAAKASQAACALKAEYRWCMTGTPLQNNLDELQSLIKFLRIEPYSDLTTWREQITKPLSSNRGGLAIRRLHVYLKAFMKRRTKDVLKLDGKGDGESSGTSGFQITKREVIRINADFTPAEINFYSRLEQRTGSSLDKMMGDKVNYSRALVLLLRLRQACNHPDLVKSDLAEDKDVLLQNDSCQTTSTEQQNDLDDVANLFGAMSVVTKKCDVCQMDLSKEEGEAGPRCRDCEGLLEHGLDADKDPPEENEEAGDNDDDDNIYVGPDEVKSPPSTKIRHLMKILRRESADHKFIVFSFFTSMLDKVEPFLKRAGIEFARYDGGMRNDHREASLDRLRNNSATRVLLCSLRTGSLGLNLTAASRVVLLEPFWNPVSVYQCTINFFFFFFFFFSLRLTRFLAVCGRTGN